MKLNFFKSGNCFTFFLIILLSYSQPVLAFSGSLNLKVLTLNLHNGLDENHLNTLAQTLQFLKDQNPDIIALQEVEQKHLKLFQEAGYHVISGMNLNLAPVYQFGDVLLSRHRIIYHRHHYLPSNLEQRGTDEVALEIDDQKLLVLNTHLGLRRAERKQQFAEIMRVIHYLSGPIIVLGDFNVEPKDHLFDEFAAEFQEVGSTFPLTNSYPTRNPAERLDQIWYNRFWQVNQAQTIFWNGSDHLPVLAELKMKEPWPDDLTQAEIPANPSEHNPFIPNLSITNMRQNDANSIGGGLTVPIKDNLIVSAVCNDDHAAFTMGYLTQAFDLRDYVSLLGIRGRGRWGLSVSISPNENPWFNWEQYYRLNAHWETNISISTEASQPTFRWEQCYLPSDHWGFSIGVDTNKVYTLSYLLNIITPKLEKKI